MWMATLVGYSVRSVSWLTPIALTQDKRVYDADDVILLKISETLSVMDEGAWMAEMESIGLDLSDFDDGLR